MSLTSSLLNQSVFAKPKLYNPTEDIQKYYEPNITGTVDINKLMQGSSFQTPKVDYGAGIKLPQEQSNQFDLFGALGDTFSNMFDSKPSYLTQDQWMKQNPGASQTQYNDYLQGQMLQGSLDQMNAIPWMDYANIGLSAFDTFNQYNMQKDMMDYYDRAINIQEDQIERSNKAKDSYSSAFSNQKV